MNLVGGVALLLWGLHMVRSGVTDAWGGQVRRVLGWSLSNRFKAFGAGLGVTMLLQSSSATALLAASFSSQAMVSTAPALAVLLGADIGTTLVAQALSFDLSLLSPLLITAGVALYLGAKEGRAREIGRVLVGLGVMLLALQLIVAASAPMRDSSAAQTVLGSLAGDPILAVLVGAFMAWLAHSSLATVLLVVSLAGSGVVAMPVAFALVLGANLGGAVPPVIATLGATPESRRPPLGNLLCRLLGVVIALPLLTLAVQWLPLLEADPVRQIANFHTAFNLGLALLFLPLVDLVARLTERLIPTRHEAQSEFRPLYLNKSALDTPPAALANAEREVLRMGEVLERMFHDTFDALQRNDQALAKRTRAMDDVVDGFYDEIRVYLTQLSRSPLGPEDSRRCADMLTFAANLEHIGDIIAINLLDYMVRKKVARQPELMAADREFVEGVYEQVRDNFSLGFAVFMSGDISAARQLLARKYKFRNVERKAQAHHLERLQHGRQTSDASTFVLDLVRDLKRVNSHLVAVAYPILDAAGQLRKSRLRSDTREEATAKEGGLPRGELHHS